MTSGPLRRRELWRVFARSLWIQGLWTPRLGQGPGFAAALWPAVARLRAEPRARAEALSAHAAYFSTHPYAAGLVLGVVAGLEADRAAGTGPPVDKIQTVRTALSGPLAALGEAFFWSTWRPLCLLAAAAVVCGAAGPSPAAPLIFLIGYNALHLAARALGVAAGFRWKTDLVPRLAALRVQRLLSGLAAAGGVGLLGLAAVAPGNRPAGVVAAVIFLGLLRAGAPVPALVAGSAVGSMVYSLLEGGS